MLGIPVYRSPEPIGLGRLGITTGGHPEGNIGLEQCLSYGYESKRCSAHTFHQLSQIFLYSMQKTIPEKTPCCLASSSKCSNCCNTSNGEISCKALVVASFETLEFKDNTRKYIITLIYVYMYGINTIFNDMLSLRELVSI